MLSGLRRPLDRPALLGDHQSARPAGSREAHRACGLDTTGYARRLLLWKPAGVVLKVTAHRPGGDVFAALAVSRWTEARTGWSIRKFVKTARRYREIKIQAGQQTITAADPVPADLRQALDAINHPGRLAH